MGERKRGGETGRSGADDGNVDVHRFWQDLLATRPQAKLVTAAPIITGHSVPPISGIFVTVDYRLEVEPTGANSARLDQFDDDNADDSVGPLFVRHSYMYLSSKKYGEVRLGLTATPIYNITKDTNVSELEDTEHGDNRMMQSFFLRPKGSDNAEGLSTLRWQSISRCYSSSNAFVCSTRRNGAAYWSPTVAGFSASVGWYKDDDWSAAIRYKDEWGENWEVGAGFGLRGLPRRAPTEWRRRRGVRRQPTVPAPQQHQLLQARHSGVWRFGVDQAQADRPFRPHLLHVVRSERLEYR
jgi:hypothetical protein